MANTYFNQFYFSKINYLVGLHGYVDLVTPVQATVVSQGITYTAVALDNAGNGITITLVGGGTAGAEVVTVLNRAITVKVEAGVSTRTQVKTAVDAFAAAAALVTVSVTSGATVVTAAAAVTTASGAGEILNVTTQGVVSVQRTGTGVYELTLSDTFPRLKSMGFQLLAATAVDLVPQGVSEAVASTKKVTFRLNTGATPTNPAAACRVYFDLLMQNTTMNY